MAVEVEKHTGPEWFGGRGGRITNGLREGFERREGIKDDSDLFGSIQSGRLVPFIRTRLPPVHATRRPLCLWSSLCLRCLESKTLAWT